MYDTENIFESYFDSNISLLKLTSFWIYEDPITKPRTKYLQLVYNLFFSIYIYFIYSPCEILFLYVTLNDLDLFLRSLRDIGNHVALIYKAVNYFLHRRAILNLVDTLKYQDCSYESCGEFQPKNIMKKHKDEALKWTKYFWIFANTICLTMLVSGLIIFIVLGDKQYEELENGERAYRQKPPVNIVSLFGNKTRLQFIVTFFFTIGALIFYAWMIVALDSLYITIMSGIAAHLEILGGAFSTLHQRCTKRRNLSAHIDELHDSYEVRQEVNQEMIRCVKHLQNLLMVSERFEAIYNVQTLFQTLISLGEMCFSLYLMSQVLDENVGNEITYLIATAFELLMYCWFGNRITEASTKLSYSIYAGDWLSTDLNFRKSMILTLTRMKRPIYVTIGKVTPLTFSTFLTIVRGAYSFFTFLKQRHGIH